MKNLFPLLFLLFALAANGQDQKIALHAGDTLEVSNLKRGTDRLFFKRNGQRSQIPLELVASFYDGYDWVGIVKAEDSMMVNREAAAVENRSISFHLEKAGDGLIISGAGFAICTIAGLLIDDEDLQIVFGIGAAVSLSAGLVVAGVNLKSASEGF
jgi:hypothetical protein